MQTDLMLPLNKCVLYSRINPLQLIAPCTPGYIVSFEGNVKSVRVVGDGLGGLFYVRQRQRWCRKVLSSLSSTLADILCALAVPQDV